MEFCRRSRTQFANLLELRIAKKWKKEGANPNVYMRFARGLKTSLQANQILPKLSQSRSFSSFEFGKRKTPSNRNQDVTFAEKLDGARKTFVPIVREKVGRCWKNFRCRMVAHTVCLILKFCFLLQSPSCPRIVLRIVPLCCGCPPACEISSSLTSFGVSKQASFRASLCKVHKVCRTKLTQSNS